MRRPGQDPCASAGERDLRRPEAQTSKGADQRRPRPAGSRHSEQAPAEHGLSDPGVLGTEFMRPPEYRGRSQPKSIREPFGLQKEVREGRTTP